MLLKNWVFTLLLVFLLGASTGQAWPVAFSVAAAVVFITTTFWRRHALDKVSYHRGWNYRRGFPGETITAWVVVENRKILPITWLRVIDPWPRALAPTDEAILSPSHREDCGELVNLYSLHWFQRIERLYQLSLRQRGLYQVGPAELESGDLFGMYEISKRQETADRFTIFPELLPLAALHLPAQDPFGDRRSAHRLFDDPTQTRSIRPYLPEDGFRRIHWPATARSGELQVKEPQPISTRVMVICLNVATQPQYWLGVDQPRLEHLVKIAATLAYQGIQAGYAVGLVSNGSLAHSDRPFQIAPGRSTDHLAQLLSALAAVTAFTNAPFESFLVQSLTKIPYGASLLVLSALLNPQLITSLFQLKRYRPHTTLLSLTEDAPPNIPGVRTIHLEMPR